MASGRLFTKSCGLAIAVWLLLVGGYGYAAWRLLGLTQPALVIGLLGGTFAAILLGSIVGFFTGGRDQAALRRAAKQEPRRDGRLEAASGPIRALEKPLEAPFSGQSCVAYEYDVKRPAEGRSDFAGFAMAPCAVDTFSGPARVLGFVTLDQFPSTADDRLDRTRGVGYLSSASFDALGVTSILSAFNELVADDDGTIRKDFRIAGDEPVLQGRRIVERVVPPGKVVTILGYWSESRGGFSAGAGSLTRLYSGDLERTRKEVGGNTIQTFIIALVFFTVLHAILVPVYVLGPQQMSARRAELAGSVWDERDCDRQRQKLRAGADANERGPDAVTALMKAARLGEPACVSQLIAAGAQLDAIDQDGDTALVLAVTANRDDNARLLLEAGAREFRVTAATGRPVTPDAAPVAAVQAYIDAIYRGDFPAMVRLKAHSSLALIEERRDDLPMWQSMRPKTFTVDSGWTTDTAATLTIRGRTSSGDQHVAYHLERQPDRSEPTRAEAAGDIWRITQEWFLER